MAELHCLYFWDMAINERMLGHIALKVWYPEKDHVIYISYWPEQPTIFKRQKGQVNQHSLLHDIKAEGNRKPKVVQIPFDFLDPAEIHRWLEIETKNPEKLYHWADCANVVCKALQLGLTARALQYEVERKFMGTRVIPVTPKEVFTWVQDKVKVYKSVKEQQRPLSVSDPAHLYPCAPLKPTENFSGRSTHLLNVCEKLKSPDKTLVVTAGIGGVGKTEFTRKVAEDVSDFFEDRIFWMDSETQESLQKCLFELSTHLKIPHDFQSETTLTMSKKEMKKLFHDIYTHFSTSNQNSLFIFDNANQFEPSSSSEANESIFLVSDFLPHYFPPKTFSHCPAILITTRSSDWDKSKDFQMVNLQNFTLDETLLYFKNSFPEASEEQLNKCELEIKELHGRFCGYTLAFTLAAGWIRGAGFSKKLKEGLKCYLQLFERPSNDLHKKDGSSTSSDTDYKFDPHEIMEQTCAAIERENPLALKVLKQMSFLAPDFITVFECCTQLNQDVRVFNVDSALKNLSKFNVISIEKSLLDGKDIIQIHGVIQRLVKEKQIKSRDVSILFEICEILLEQEYSTILPHLKSLVCNLEEFRATLSFWFFSKKTKCDHYLKQLRLKINS